MTQSQLAKTRKAALDRASARRREPKLQGVQLALPIEGAKPAPPNFVLVIDKAPRSGKETYLVCRLAEEHPPVYTVNGVYYYEREARERIAYLSQLPCKWPHDNNTVECICGWKNPGMPGKVGL